MRLLPKPRLRRGASSRPREYAELAPFVFALLWLSLFVLHTFCAFYFMAVAKVYGHINGTYLAYWIHAVLAGIHACLGGLMVLGSLIRRQLVFSPLQDLRYPSKTSSSKKSCWFRLFDLTFGRHGVFGVQSRYFERIHFVRQCVETVLQTYQAYRLSRLVPRAWLNRFYVALLVVNCWAIPFVRVLLRQRAMLRRLLALLCDGALDLVSSICISVILLATYYGDYDTTLGDFRPEIWRKDIWLVNFMSEFQLVLVVSWADLLIRLVFSLGLIGCMDNVKDLLRQQSKTAHVTSIDQLIPAVSVQPVKSSECSSSTLGPSTFRFKSRLVWMVHLVFVIWGLIVLFIHLHAESRGHLAQCLVQLRPWATRKPACALLLADCRYDGIHGLESEISRHWDSIDADSVTHLLVRHCSQLHMPSHIQDFSRLHSMKIYNSTIVEWNTAAALTNTHHPIFSGFVAVRVNMTNAQLPPGLMSSNFPSSLGSIEFIATNLASLPEDLDSSWPAGMVLGFEVCQFSQLPPVLLRVAPSQLSFAGNLFTAFPFEAFAIPGLIYLNFDSNPIVSLRPEPHQTVDVGSIRDLYLMDTTISSLPRWIDQLFQLVDEYEPLHLYNTPFCDDVREIRHGRQSGFPDTETPDTELSVVMKDMMLLDSSVSCVYYEVDYPLALEDTWHT